MSKLLYIFLLTCSFAFGQRINFHREDVTCRLDGEYLRVEGYYWFSNESNVAVRSEIYYPFPHDSGGLVDSMKVYNLTRGQETFIGVEKFGLSFFVDIEPSDTSLFQIKYRQRLNSDSAVYILKTTKSWGKPLDVAEFKLMVPDSLKIKHFTYPPDQLYKIEKLCIYLWKRQCFMPDRNLVFYF